MAAEDGAVAVAVVFVKDDGDAVIRQDGGSTGIEARSGEDEGAVFGIRGRGQVRQAGEDSIGDVSEMEDARAGRDRG